jgi:hypothetical protein
VTALINATASGVAEDLVKNKSVRKEARDGAVPLTYRLHERQIGPLNRLTAKVVNFGQTDMQLRTDTATPRMLQSFRELENGSL